MSEEACGRCAASLVAEASFCHSCGAPVRDAPGAPRSYTPRHLSEEILVSRSAMEGERKVVTVLFADVKESMALAEHVDAESWHRILDRFFAILAEGVHRFEGTINQFTGDGIMALFGAPMAHEDHAERACLAALHLQDELRRYANALRLERGLNFSVRMGISSGIVVVGKIGDDLRMDYTAQGHTVGLAARMQQIAESGRVYLTRETAELVEGELDLTDLGVMQVKGAREPVRVYVLEGAGPASTRLDRARARGLSRLVGRSEELAILESALGRAKRGQGQVVGVVGPAGVGKSRLCSEFVARCRAEGVMVHEVHCTSHASAPLDTAVELLRRLLDVGADDGDLRSREKIAGRLLLLDPMFEEALPSIFALLGVADPERDSPPLEPEARLRKTSNLLRRLVQMHGGSATTVLLIDDAHWIDAGSSAVVGDLVELFRGARFLLLANFRPEHRSPWLDAAHCHRLPLAPLGDEACDDLLNEWLGENASLAELRARVRERAQGNPFFIEELIRSFAASGIVSGSRGAYVLGRSFVEPDLPVTVQAVLASRIDRLNERDKRVLQVAAAIGKEFSLPVLSRVLQLSGSEVGEIEASLRTLVRERFITTGARTVDVDYAFEHPLTHEVAYQSQLAEHRARLHAAVASALEELCADRLGSQAEKIAAHWEAAGRRGQAIRWRRRAALRVTSIQLGHRGARFSS